MRPGQNKRMRGRNNNNNRKGPNPLTRSYESNGPDVKIRGTAHHIAEKYLQLARDAQSSGDPVMAESYLQHAEHYFRLIAAAQQAQQQAAYGYQQRPGEPAETEDGDDDDDFVSLPDRFASPSERAQAAQPQPQPFDQRPPFQNGGQQPYEQRQDRGNQDRNYDRQGGGQPYPDRQQAQGDRQERGGQERGSQERGSQERGGQERGGQERGGYDNRNGRGYYQDRNNQDRGAQDRGAQDRGAQDRGNQDRGNQGQQDRPPRDFDNNRGFRNNRGPRDFRENGPPREAREQRQPADEAPGNGLPAFITGPSRSAPESDSQPDVAEAGTQPTDSGDENFHMRPRRRRRTRPEFAGEAGGDEPQHETPAGDVGGE